MNPFYRPQITDELLSAYIDGAVTNEEKLQIEKAVQNDATVAWRLESLRQTVNLLRSLPELPLPRSFVLTEADLAPQSKALPPFVTTARRISPPPRPAPQRSGFWESMRDFLQGGSLLLRNLATTGLAVWLVLFATTQINPTKTTIERIEVAGAGSSVAATTVAESTPLGNAAERVAVVPNTTTESPALPTPTNAEAQTSTFSQQAQPTAEVLAPLTAAPVTQEQPSESLKAMGGGQPAGEQAFASPGEDISGGLDAAISAVGASSDTSAADAQASGASAPTDTEMAAPSIAAAAIPPAEEQPESATVASSEVENSVTTSASESPLVTASQANEPQAAAEQPSVAAPAAQVEEPTPTPMVEPTTTSEPTAVLAIPMLNGQTETQIEPYAAPAQPTAVAVAQAARVNEAAQTDQERPAQPIEKVSSTPYFDPVRMQLAQLVVALVTAVLALFWLGSHLGRRG